MRSGCMGNGIGGARTRGRMALTLAGFFMLIALMVSSSVAAPSVMDQQGVSKTICHADNVYIYKYSSTGSERRWKLGRGASFQVYHYVNGTWAFGVHNASGVSGYVLREKLCN
jgi:hypothetical protein